MTKEPLEREKVEKIFDDFAKAYDQWNIDSDTGEAENYEEMRNRHVYAITQHIKENYVKKVIHKVPKGEL